MVPLPTKMTEQAASYFARHGQLCTSRPMEIIATTLTLTVIFFSYVTTKVQQKFLYPENDHLFSSWAREFFHMSQETYRETFREAHLALMTLFRCMVVVHCYNQILMVQQVFSKYVAGYTALFAMVSALVFSSGVINILYLDFAQLGDFILFYILWMDSEKLSLLIQTGLRSSNYSDLSSGMAQTLDQLGPSMTFDMIIQILITSIAFIPGLRRLEFLASLALLAILMNYIIFMTMFPALLSMIAEFQMTRNKRRAPLALDKAIPPVLSSEVSSSPQQQTPQQQQQAKNISKITAPFESSPQLNSLVKFKPVVGIIGSRPPVILQSHNHANSIYSMVSIVKLVIALSFLLLQSYSYRCNTSTTVELNTEASVTGDKMYRDGTNRTDQVSEITNTYSLIIGFLLLRMDQLVVLGLILILSVKYLLFDSKMEAREASPVPPFETARKMSKRFGSKKLVQKSMSMSNLAAMDCEEDQEGAQELSGSKEGLEAPAISFTVGESESDSDLETSRKTSRVLGIFETKEIQTDESFIEEEKKKVIERMPTRSLLECARIYHSEEDGGKKLSDIEVISLVDAKTIPAYQLEKAVQDEERGVTIRRKLLGRSSTSVDDAFDSIPYKNYDYSKITGACCENVVGYIPVPVGVAGPLYLDGKHYQVPMATTEGCLVASTSRGCRALCNGVRSRVVGDGMTRGPVVRFPSAMRASEAMCWLQDYSNFKLLKESFDGSSRFARLEKVSCRIAGRYLFIRFVAKTGDAMGMNMISKGTEVALNTLQDNFQDMEILSLSGNFCTDKKPAAVNWIEGRGKSVVAEAVVPAHIIQNVLKTSTAALVELNIAKNLVGSAMAGSIGGYNAHAANIVAAIFIATGQDTAQCVGSSNCMTLMEPWGNDGQDLFISCTMPSIEVGTIGGGTVLSPQSACLTMLGLQGPNPEEPGKNARDLARVVCATVLAGELSLMSALAAGHLVRSHLKHNRSSTNVDASLRTVSTSPASFSTRNNHLSPRVINRSNNNGKELIPKILTTTHNQFNTESLSLRNISINSSNNNNSKCVPPSIPNPLEETTTPVSNLVMLESPTSMSVPIPTKSMDLLSVPTECKQF